MTLDIDATIDIRRLLLSRCDTTCIVDSFDESEELEFLQREESSVKPATSLTKLPTATAVPSRMNILKSSSSASGRRSRFSSLNRSCDSTESSNSSACSRGNVVLPSKTTYRILVLGASKTGKTSIVRQFLYDQFSPLHQETMDDMYRGEFEDAHGQTINFDIQDVGGNFVYEFPAMKSVSLASADAFVLVFSLDDSSTWEEVNRLRDMVLEAKSSDSESNVPIVVVANKADKEVDTDLPYESLEATAIFDWENGYVEASAKDRTNINKIFRELLNQAKTKFDVNAPAIASPSKVYNGSVSVARHLPGVVAMHQKAIKEEDKCLKRRQSLPAVGMLSMPNPASSKVCEDDVFFNSPRAARRKNGERVRRSSLAVLRRDSCKIS